MPFEKVVRGSIFNDTVFCVSLYTYKCLCIFMYLHAGRYYYPAFHPRLVHLFGHDAAFEFKHGQMMNPSSPLLLFPSAPSHSRAQLQVRVGHVHCLVYVRVRVCACMIVYGNLSILLTMSPFFFILIASLLCLP